MTPTYNRVRRERSLRNIAPSWDAAIEGGFLRYRGEPCTTCGSEIRALATRECAACRKVLSRKRSRVSAEAWREHHAAAPPLTRKGA
jgi:hypothetical protein